MSEGADHPRTVRVGYEAHLNRAEGQREAPQALAQRPVTAGSVRAVRFLDTKLTTLASVFAPEFKGAYRHRSRRLPQEVERNGVGLLTAIDDTDPNSRLLRPRT